MRIKKDLKVEGARFNIGAFFLLSFIAILLYANSIHSPFIWDDQYLIAENHFIKGFKFIPEIFKHHLYYSSAGVSNFYRPLQNLFLMVDYSLWKTNAVGYHITNIIFHLLCAFFAYLLIDSIFKRKYIAFMVGLLFLVHPANSTVVNYISSRADSQAALFVLLTLYLFVRYASLSPSGIIYLAGSLISFILALLSKELAIMLPFLLLAATPFISNGKKDILKKTAPFFIILGVYAALRLTLLNFPSAGSGEFPSLHIRLLTSAESFTRLIGLLFIPLKIHIEKSIPYSSGLFQATTLCSLIALMGIGIFIFWVRRYSKICLFGLIWFFITLMPMANIVPINATMADHWLYLPCIGLFLSVIGGTADLIERLNIKTRDLFKTLALCLYVLVVIVFSALTIKQNGIWRDPLTFYRLAIKYSPDSYRAHNEIGIIYLHQDRFDMAISELKEAVRINPRFDQAYDNLGVAYDKKGEPKKAIAQYEKALKIKPGNPKIYNNLGNAYNKMNRFDEAIEAYREALRLAPDFKAVYNNLGVVYYKKGMYKETEKYWNKALELDPTDKGVRDNIKVLEGIKKKSP